MQLDDIEMILVISETHSLSQASERLYISRQALSKKLTSIEQRYGTKLFERSSTGIFPTPSGQILTKYASNVASMERTLAAELAAAGEHFESTIQVGMSINDGVALLPKLAKSFHDEHCDARIHLDAGYEYGLIEKLRSGVLDFALLENMSIDKDLDSRSLGLKQLVFACPNTSPYNSVPQPIPVRSLLEWPMIIYEWDSGRHMVGNRHFRERYGLSLDDHNIVAEFDTHEAMMNGISAGLGWGSVPECIAARYKNDPSIIWPSIDTEPMRYSVDIAWVSDRVTSPLAESFRDYIIDNVPENYFKSKTSE